MSFPSFQLEARNRPPGRHVMLQNWRHLLFLHAAYEPDIIQQTLPAGLTVDTFPDETGKEMAWVGLVPFTMHGIRPLWSPAVPWLSRFHEVNVRTYVHRDGQNPGVWFYSLDAERLLACKIARWSYALPYFHARMSMVHGDSISYRSKRANSCAELDLTYTLGNNLVPPEPGSLEFFLVERYRLYAERYGALFDGLVHHIPYPLQNAKIESCSETMLEAAGIPKGEFQHVCYSPGVDVEIWPIRRLG